MPSRETDTLIPLIQEHTRPGSLYYTDDWHAYGSLRLRGNHVIIKKEDGRPKGRDHINGIEGFWSYAKHWLYQYRGVHKKFFHLYLGELSFRFNHRDTDIFPLIYKLLHQYDINDLRNILVRFGGQLPKILNALLNILNFLSKNISDDTLLYISLNNATTTGAFGPCFFMSHS